MTHTTTPTRIFLIDDDIEHAVRISRLLQQWFSIAHTDSIQASTDQLDLHHPHVILFDYFLGADAEMAYASVQQYAAKCSIPVVLFSAVFNIERWTMLLKFDSFIEKQASASFVKKHIDDLTADNQ